jgi:hypothetical protein
MAEININEWRAELDAVTAMLSLPPKVEIRGFTVMDLAEHTQPCVSRMTAYRHIEYLIKQGEVRCIGVRPGQGGAKVYEVIKDHIKE